MTSAPQMLPARVTRSSFKIESCVLCNGAKDVKLSDSEFYGPCPECTPKDVKCS